ncbi:MAG: NADH-quinone oxidoreductase subunit N [Actinomycetota bacterium]|nr:NADH-quinone oxidoreductase subunit N [Actinomycetota bacterium]
MENIAFLPIGPEIIMLFGAVLVLMSAVALDQGRRDWGIIGGISLVVAFLLSLAQWLRLDFLDSTAELSFTARGVASFRHPMVIMDRFSAFAGMLIYLVAFLALVGNWRLVTRLGKRGAEYVALVLLATAGLHMMAISSNLILLFMGLETASIALYIIAGFVRVERNSDESALKYFLLGSFASAIFLYGIALVYAGTGSISIYGPGGIIDFFATEPVAFFDVGILLTGIALMIVGLAFKISAAPFHQWAPDVYQGAASGSVALMAAGVKVAGIAALARVLLGAFPSRINDWAPLIAALAIISITLGTIGAIGQRDIKRMLAYSGVAHAGFMLTGLVAGIDGLPAVWFYVATYVLQVVGAFTIVGLVAGVRSGGSALDDYKGLWVRSPALAGSMAVFMLGMGGIPMFSGLVGKVGVLFSAEAAGYVWLATAGLVAAVAGLFFYLRVVVLMFFEAPVMAEAPGTATTGPRLRGGAGFVVVFTAAATVLLGIVPWPLLNVVRNALL